MNDCMTMKTLKRRINKLMKEIDKNSWLPEAGSIEEAELISYVIDIDKVKDLIWKILIKVKE